MPLTYQQIITLACQQAKAPGYTAQAGQLFNMILSDLADTQDLDLCRGTFNFNFITDNGSGNGSGPYPLPADYKRAVKDGVWYEVSGVPYFPRSIEQSEYDALVQTSGIADYPTCFYVDLAPQGQQPALPANMYVWAPASGSFPVTVRYRRQLPDVSSPQTSTEIPWFPNQGFLLTQLSGLLMGLTDDERALEFLSDDPNGFGAGNLLRKYMQLANDNEGRAINVSLDRRRFGKPWSSLRTTKKVGWP